MVSIYGMARTFMVAAQEEMDFVGTLSVVDLGGVNFFACLSVGLNFV